ncbi:MAG: hypothetical protein HY843_07920 [Bdellovibrio sp.]|nr:hypothetical protein [Bdellovibrio sp.]
MRCLNNLLKAILLLVMFLYTYDSYAYLDPGTGSYLLQIILGTLFATFFTLKLYWRKIKAYFQEKFIKK